MQSLAPLEHHRRVVPRDVIREIPIGDEFSDQSLHDPVYLVRSSFVSEVRHRDLYAFFRFSDNEPRIAVMENRLFNKQNVVLFRESRQQMLWPLKNKIPSQMRKHDDAVTGRRLRVWESSNTHIFEQNNLLVAR